MLRDLLTIYLLFFRMGAVTFGGGFAMLPILRREIVQTHKWLDEETILDAYALSQGLPGIIAVNVSAFVGYQRRKTAGAVAAALGIVSPCIIIISAIAFFLAGFQQNLYVQRALAGVSVCVAALIFDTVIGLWKKSCKDWIGIVLCLVMLGLSVLTKISPVLLVIACALIGVGVKTPDHRAARGGKDK